MKKYKIIATQKPKPIKLVRLTEKDIKELEKMRNDDKVFSVYIPKR